MIDFKNVEFKDLKDISKHLENNTNMCCEYSVGNLWIWDIEDKLEYACIDGYLVLRMIDNDVAAYSIPYGMENIGRIINECIVDAIRNNKTFVMRHISMEMIQEIEKIFPEKFIVSYNRDKSDYIYNVSDLAELKGRKYHGKKNHVNQFMKRDDFSYERIDSSNIEECRKMKNRWAENNVPDENHDDDSYREELYVVDKALDYFDKLNFTGALIRIDGKVVAFTIGERLNTDTFVTHIEKADSNIRGLYPAINMLFAQNELSGFKYVNREEDLGIEGLRKAKESYYPAILYNKYEIMLKN